MEKIKQFFTKYPWVQHVILMVVISIVLVFLISLFIKCYARHGKEFEMPQFAYTDSTPGMTVEEAMENNDLDLEFVVNDSSEYRSDVKPGVILKQDPKAGTMVKKGRTVYVSIAASKDVDIIMPNLRDLSLRGATSKLESLKLKVGTITYVDDEDKNKVLEQRIKGRVVAPGEKVAPGTVIDLEVANGVNPYAPQNEIIIDESELPVFDEMEYETDTEW